MRISDWSSDVCSSDLAIAGTRHRDKRRGGKKVGRHVPRIYSRHREPTGIRQGGSRITTYTDGGGSASILLCRSVPPFAHLYPFRPARPAIHHHSRHVVFARRRRSEEHTSELQS